MTHRGVNEIKNTFDLLHVSVEDQTNAGILIRLLEREAKITFAKADTLFVMLVRRLAALRRGDQVERSTVEAGKDNRLYWKLTEAYRVLQDKTPTDPPLCKVPDGLEDVFLAFTKTEPLYQEGPGYYGAVYAGDRLLTAPPPVDFES